MLGQTGISFDFNGNRSILESLSSLLHLLLNDFQGSQIYFQGARREGKPHGCTLAKTVLMRLPPNTPYVRQSDYHRAEYTSKCWRRLSFGLTLLLDVTKMCDSGNAAGDMTDTGVNIY